MTTRSLSAIIFGIVIFIELLVFITLPNITKRVEDGNTKGFFSGYATVTDNAAKQDRNIKYIVIIGATAVIGAIVTFSLKNEKTEKK